MGKFRSKLKGQTKGKRWPKGQSSNSNPETHKYREQAKSRFFQENLGNSNLTASSLKKHDAVQTFLPKPIENTESIPMEQEEDAVSLIASSVSTFSSAKSFASEWTNCTNMSYNRLLNVFQPDSALHKEMLAILAAITEVIKENEGNETPTEYYCSLITTLEQVYNSDEKNEMQITAVLSLLNMGIKTVPEGVLRSSFNDVTAKMLTILNDYVNSDNNTIIKSVLGVLGVLLKQQELAIWTHDSTKQLFNSLLNPFCIHTKPKWRKAGQNAVLTILHSDHLNNLETNPVGLLISNFCNEILENSINGTDGNSIQAEQTTILHILGLMKDTICKFPKSHMKKSCEIILQLMTLNYPIVNSCGFQVLHGLFSAKTTVVPSKLNAQLISALYDYQPATNDVQPTLAWLAVMQQAHIHLADSDLDFSCTVLPKIFSRITQLWLSVKTEIMSSATFALEALLKDTLTPVCLSKELVEKHQSKLIKCFSEITDGLKYQFITVWHQVLHVISVMFEVAGLNCGDLLVDCLKALTELRDSYKFTYNSELEHAVGAAIRSMGPEFVLNIIHLKKQNGDLNLDRSWLIPVLKENIKVASLEYFLNGVLPLAIYCQKRSTQLAEINDGIGAHSSELLYMQLWSLLPCFCNNPTDIKTNFKSLAKVLGMAISNKKELRLPVMAALRKLIACAKENVNENPDDLSELKRYDKNYLPILFNVYTTKPIGDGEGERLAALDTIKVYLSIAKPELTEELLTNSLERLNSSSDDPEDLFIKENILDLIRALIPYQNQNKINLIYEQCIKNKLISENKNRKEQKKAYRLLEEICGSESENCKKFIETHRKYVQKLLMKSLDSAVVSSKGARLRCLNYLIKAQPNLSQESKLIQSTIAEAILSCKDLNEKTRKIAYDLLNTIGDLLLGHNQIQDFLTIILSGLAGNPQLISCTILALTSILHNFSGTLGQENIKIILENINILMASATREIVSSCLSFIKVYCTSLPTPMVAASLSPIVKGLCSMSDDCKRCYRLKVRDILDRLVRKYGYEYIITHVPVNDKVMYKRIKNLRKLNDRKKRKKEMDRNENSESDNDDFMVKAKPRSVEEILADSDSDPDDMETDQPKVDKKKKSINTWIKEDFGDIVDFTNPNVVKKITATKPNETTSGTVQIDKKNKEKDRGFKSAPDGRLIITDNDSSDDDTKDKKIKLNFDSDDDSDEDQKSVAETLVLSDRKRKRSSSVKSGVSSQPPTKYKPGGVGIHRNVKASTSSVRSGQLGDEYKSKKAKGDVKKKGKCDPYAYVPLHPSLLNKRKKKKAAAQFKNIIKSAKSGTLKGAKAKRKMK